MRPRLFINQTILTAKSRPDVNSTSPNPPFSVYSEGSTSVRRARDPVTGGAPPATHTRVHGRVLSRGNG